MATGKQIEQLDKYRADGSIKQSRQAVLSGLNNFSSGVTLLKAIKTLIDYVEREAREWTPTDYGSI